MRELVLTCAMAILGSGCVDVVSHIDEFDSGPDVKLTDGPREAETSGGQCVSGQHWTGGTTPSGLHYPGRPCMGSGCHTSSSKTQFTMAGTVYPLKGDHDENDCNGIDGAGVAVVPTDDMAMEFAGRLQLNPAGNFTSNKPLPPSFHVKVVALGREAAQVSAVMDGNCNYCHTPEGLMGAKGRILPLAP